LFKFIVVRPVFARTLLSATQGVKRASPAPVKRRTTEEMDVTLTTGHNTSMRYAGTILSRSQVALVADEPHAK